MNTLRIALAQINPTVGDLEKNTALVLDYIDRSRKVGADIVAFPELALTGYPPEDLLLKPHFVRENIEALDRIIEAAKDLIVVVGFVDTDGSDIYNAAAVIAGRKTCRCLSQELSCLTTECSMKSAIFRAALVVRCSRRARLESE